MTQEAERLQELLARVQRNAAMPRLVAPAFVAPPAAFAASPAAYVAPAAAPPPPAAYAPPPAVFEPEPVTFVHEAPAAPPSAPAIQAAPLDASVDDLLLEDPFPSVRAPAPPSYSEVLEEDAIPLVSLSSPRSADDEDISGVMVIGELTEEQPEELLEDDIVEMTSSSDAAEAVAPGAGAIDDLDFDDDELDGAHTERLEEPPASSSRSKIAGTMDEALARAAEQIEHDEGREVPLKTPPPESGPQEAMALPVGIHAPLPPDIEELLEADIKPRGGVNAAVPTQEQLGQTIDLDEARGPSLELDHPPAFVPEPLEEELPPEELEVTLPQREFGGGYQENLMPPPDARKDLDAHLQRVGSDPSPESVPPPPESLAQYPSHPPAAPSHDFAPVIVPSSVTTDSTSDSVSTVTVDAPAHAEFAPELLARPEAGPSPVAKFIRVEAPRPKTFLEALDASLSLGSNH